MSPRRWFPVAVVLVLLGIVGILLQPVLDPKPDSECAAPGMPYSGYVDEDKTDCNITDESWEEIREWETGAKPYRVLGVVLVLTGVVAGVLGLLSRRRTRGGDR